MLITLERIPRNGHYLKRLKNKYKNKDQFDPEDHEITSERPNAPIYSLD
jgi:hypothetical protein